MGIGVERRREIVTVMSCTQPRKHENIAPKGALTE